MEKSNHFSRVWQRLVSVFLVFALFIGIFPARIIHAEDPEEDLFISESSEEMAEDYAVWPYDTLPEENDHLDENANITEENLLNREEAIKDFRLDNGMNVAVSYPYSVHYKENEEWKEIDNTLKSIENDKGVFYHNEAGMWDVYLPQVLSKDHSVIVSKEGNTLSFSFEGELYDDDEITNINETTGQIEEKEYPEEYDEPDMQVLKKIVSTVNYPNVYEDTDLRYDLISNCLKETVILKSYKEGLVGY
ncbi:MAG: hypothetical protein II783_02550, partial [Erysipelotrichales bacterium]|nr:hypothetical protein [Erysipelotrichales bacterium]